LAVNSVRHDECIDPVSFLLCGLSGKHLGATGPMRMRVNPRRLGML